MEEELSAGRMKFGVTLVHHAHNSKPVQNNAKTNHLDG